MDERQLTNNQHSEYKLLDRKIKRLIREVKYKQTQEQCDETEGFKNTCMHVLFEIYKPILDTEELDLNKLSGDHV